MSLEKPKSKLKSLLSLNISTLAMLGFLHCKDLHAAEIPPHFDKQEGLHALQEAAKQGESETLAIYVCATDQKGDQICFWSSGEGKQNKVSINEKMIKHIFAELQKNSGASFGSIGLGKAFRSITLEAYHTHTRHSIEQIGKALGKTWTTNFSMPPSIFDINLSADKRGELTKITFLNGALLYPLKNLAVSVGIKMRVVDNVGVWSYRKYDKEELKKVFPDIPHIDELEKRRRELGAELLSFLQKACKRGECDWQRWVYLMEREMGGEWSREELEASIRELVYVLPKLRRAVPEIVCFEIFALMPIDLAEKIEKWEKDYITANSGYELIRKAQIKWIDSLQKRGVRESLRGKAFKELEKAYARSSVKIEFEPFD